jgi:hypothetical protein
MSPAKDNREWILTPNQDYTPTGVLQLGQILTNYKKPSSAILTKGVVSIPSELPKDKTIHNHVSYESSDSQAIALKAWLEATSAIASSKTANTSESAYKQKFQGFFITAEMFQPSKQYIDDALQKYMKDMGEASTVTDVPWYMLHRRVWMVTGLRTFAKGTKVTQGSMHRDTAMTAFKADGQAAGIAASAGADAARTSQTDQTHEIGSSDEFIFCYRLHEIIIKRQFKKTRLAPFSRGHIQDAEQSGNGSDDEGLPVYNEAIAEGYEVLGVDEQAYQYESDEDDSDEKIFVP